MRSRQALSAVGMRRLLHIADREGGGLAASNPVILPVILRLPQPRLELWCVRRWEFAAEDAEGPPASLQERMGALTNTCCHDGASIDELPPPDPASTQGVLRRPPPRD